LRRSRLIKRTTVRCLRWRPSTCASIARLPSRPARHLLDCHGPSPSWPAALPQALPCRPPRHALPHPRPRPTRWAPGPGLLAWPGRQALAGPQGPGGPGWRGRPGKIRLTWACYPRPAPFRVPRPAPFRVPRPAPTHVPRLALLSLSLLGCPTRACRKVRDVPSRARFCGQRRRGSASSPE
jgi:hypothetical protein